MNLARRLVLLVAFGVTACSNASGGPTPSTAADARTALQSLGGTWRDPSPYAYGKAFGQREFTFDRGTWSLRFTLFLDPGGKSPVFTFRTHGRYEVGAASTAVPGAYDTRFTEEQKLLTLDTPDPGLAKAFGFDACGLQVGLEKDVSATGCSRWPAVSACPADHDLLALLAPDRLAFGERPADNDMCTPDKRPTALTPAVQRQ